jgi:multidrug resistance protein
VVIGIITGINTNLGMSLPSGAAKVIAKHFSVTDPLLLVLLTSIYLLGFALGPLVFGPLSERLGRRPVLVSAYLLYALWTACCGLSPSYGALLAFRFLAGAAAAAPMAVAGALYADVYNDPERRGRAIAYFMCIGMSSPNLGPAISGYAGHVSWNLPFWIGAALAGVFVPLVLLLPETYAPALERHARAKAVVAGGDGGQQVQGSVSRSIFGGMGKDVRVVFSQPFVMMGREPVVMFTSLYCAFVYALPFLFFQAYPIIYKSTWGREDASSIRSYAYAVTNDWGRYIRIIARTSWPDVSTL